MLFSISLHCGFEAFNPLDVFSCFAIDTSQLCIKSNQISKQNKNIKNKIDSQIDFHLYLHVAIFPNSPSFCASLMQYFINVTNYKCQLILNKVQICQHHQSSWIKRSLESFSRVITSSIMTMWKLTGGFLQTGDREEDQCEINCKGEKAKNWDLNSLSWIRFGQHGKSKLTTPRSWK